MLKFKVIKNNQVTHSWLSDSGLDEKYYEPGFGLQERWVPHKDELDAQEYDDADVLEELEIELEPAYTIEISPAIEAKEAVLDSDGNILEPAIEASPAVLEEVPAKVRKEVKLRAEYTIEIVDITAQLEQERINKECLEYLAATDWMVIRQVDRGIPVPEEVKVKRAEAANKIVR